MLLSREQQISEYILQRHESIVKIIPQLQDGWTRKSSR